MRPWERNGCRHPSGLKPCPFCSRSLQNSLTCLTQQYSEALEQTHCLDILRLIEIPGFSKHEMLLLSVLWDGICALGHLNTFMNFEVLENIANASIPTSEKSSFYLFSFYNYGYSIFYISSGFWRSFFFWFLNHCVSNLCCATV